MRIDGELYWDGGILSNTPTEAIFDDNPRRNSLIFAVHLWNPTGDEPETIWEVLNRHKDIQYSSRIASHIARQREAHRLRHVITELLKYVPEAAKNDPLERELAGYGCPTRMHVVRLLAPRLDNESHTKDIDFSPPAFASAGRPAMPTPTRACTHALDRRIRSARRRGPARAGPGADPAAEISRAAESGAPTTAAQARRGEKGESDEYLYRHLGDPLAPPPSSSSSSWSGSTYSG